MAGIICFGVFLSVLITGLYEVIGNIYDNPELIERTNIMKGYQINASEMERACNVLTEVGQKYAISASELATGMQIVCRGE